MQDQEVTGLGGYMALEEEHHGKEKKIRETSTSCLGTGLTCTRA